jgi:hypothetical protein
MTSATITSVIMAAIANSWGTITPICYPNRHFTAPQSAWIRPIIKMGETIVGELGVDGIGMRQGLLMISVFGLLGGGYQTLLGYADTLEAMFRRKELSGIVFNEPNTDIPGADDDGYYHVLVSVDFTTWVGE